ncbi:MAG: DoxX family protein [Bacteroidota bacterium]
METYSDLRENQWSIGYKWLFTWLALYVLLYTFPFPISSIPGLNVIFQPYTNLWNWLIPIVGKNILGIEYEIATGPNGSGDTTADYVRLFMVFSFSLVGSIIWTALDRKRPHYQKLLFWLTVLIRYYLGFMMLSYGFAKVFKLQFQHPSLFRLLEPFGEASPMGLVWTFMGASTPYTVFTGWGEVIGGLLLLFRRTTSLGAVVLIAVMTNVVMINFSYDVPVKLFSSNLLLMAVFLLALDYRRMLNLFLLNKPTGPQLQAAPFEEDHGKKLAFRIFKGLFVALYLGLQITQGVSAQKNYGEKKPKPPLFGIYEVDQFVLNQDTLPPLTTDTTRWQRLLFERWGGVRLQKMDDSYERLSVEVDSSLAELNLWPRQDTVNQYTFSYQWMDSTQLEMQGIWAGDTLWMQMRRKGPEDFQLMNRGFRWINEYPHNR